MTSDAKIAANRRNAQNSTGPRSKVGKARTRQNAFRHGLAVPVVQDLIAAPIIAPLANALGSEMELSPSLEPVQLAAEAHAEITRIRRAKVQLLNRVAQQNDVPSDAGVQFDLIMSEAFIATMEALKTFDRYEQRSIAKREQALRALSRASRAQLIRADPDRRFVQSLNQFRVDRIVKTAILQPQSPNTPGSSYCLTVDFASISSSTHIRALVQLSAPDTGTLRIDLYPAMAATTASIVPVTSQSVAIDSADPTKPALSATFAISKISIRGGGRWVARCPKTARQVSHLYWCAGTGQLGSRLALNLSYRSQKTATARRDAPERQLREDAWLQYARLIVQEQDEPPAPLDRDRDWAGRKRRPNGAIETVASDHQNNDGFSAARKRQARRRQSMANVERVRSSSRQQPRALLAAASPKSGGPRRAPTSQSQATVTNSPVRNVDRKHYQHTVAVGTPENVDSAVSSFVSVDAALADSKDYMKQGKIDEAVAAVRVGLAALGAVRGTTDVGRTDDNPAAQERLQRLVYRLGELANKFLLSRAYRHALELADEALSCEPTLIWIHLTRFHAFMFMARITDAMTLFRQYRHERIIDEWSWQDILLEQFSALKTHGLSHPLMEAVHQQVNSERGQRP